AHPRSLAVILPPHCCLLSTYDVLTTIYPLSLHDALPISPWAPVAGEKPKPKDLVDVIIATRENGEVKEPQPYQLVLGEGRAIPRSEEHTSELQSRVDLVCRLLLEKKKKSA